MTIDLTYFGKLLIATLAFCVVGIVIGCLLDGLDRKISAKMQRRVGPPILQPFYDVKKLFCKERAAINSSEYVYVATSLFFAILAGGIFFSGGNILLCIFVISLSSLLLIMASYCSRSPYADAGGAREILQVLSYEPAVLLFGIVFVITTISTSESAAETGNILSLLSRQTPLIADAWAIFIALVFVLTIKLRKSPFDLSSSHHAHQELVSGMTTEMTGRTLALVEITHWVESVLFLAWIGAFFVWSNSISIVFGIVAALAIWFFEIIIDNNSARVKYQAMLASSWIVAFVLGIVNLGFLIFF